MTEIEEALAFVFKEVDLSLQKFIGIRLTPARVASMQHHAAVALYETMKTMLFEVEAEDIYIEDFIVDADGSTLSIRVTGDTLESIKEALERKP